MHHLATVFNALYSALAIVLSLFIGKFISSTFGGLPPSLYGLLVFTLALQLGMVKARRIEQTISWIINHMGVCFVPAGLGIINHTDLVISHGISMLLIIIITTFGLMAIVGIGFEHLAKFSKKNASNDS